MVVCMIRAPKGKWWWKKYEMEGKIWPLRFLANVLCSHEKHCAPSQKHTHRSLIMRWNAKRIELSFENYISHIEIKKYCNKKEKTLMSRNKSVYN